MTPTVAYLAEGKLYVKRGGAAPELIDSPFVQQMLERVERSRQRHDWKKGMGWQLGARGLMGQMGEPPAEVRRVRYSGLTRGQGPGELFYAIDTDHVGGLFAYDRAQRHERRLFHRNDFRAQTLARHRSAGTLVLSIRADDRSAHIAIMESDGKGLKEITEGDAVDEAPSWAPGEDKQLVFQSAGIGRNQAGFFVALGPYAIQKLDLDRGDLTTLLEEPASDLLLPREMADGTLLFIRRPYEPLHGSVSPLKVLLDIVLFPYRLAVAIVHFLNWFSHVFARKPLITAGGPPREGPDARFMMLWGKMIDAEKAIRAAKSGEAKALVPQTWQLIRRNLADGSEQVLAKGVLAYDVADDGTIVYSNGSTIFHIPAGGDGKPVEICNAKMIEHVALVD